MARNIKKAEDLYREILGGTLDECLVLSFQFPDRESVACFHFDIMSLKATEGGKILLFDGKERGATVIVRKSEGIEDELRAAAERWK